MRIVHVYVPGASGVSGVDYVVHNLAESQLKLGHDVKVYNISSKLNNKFDKFAYTFKLFKKNIKEDSPDIVVFHSLYLLKYLLFSCYLRLLKIPYCIEFHGGSSKENAQKSKYKKIVANYLGFYGFIKKSAAVIYLNEAERSDSIMLKYASDSLVIPNGINLPIINCYKKKDMRKRKIELFFLARISIIHKGVDILLEALKLLDLEGFSQYFNFTFYGPDQTELGFENYISGLEHFVKYNGLVCGKEKENAFMSSDIYVLTSRYEGMPITVLEALSYGCPCLITPQTNMANLIEENNAGWVTELNPNDIAGTIKQIIEKYYIVRDSLVDNSIKAASKYDWTEVGSLSITQYRSVIPSK